MPSEQQTFKYRILTVDDEESVRTTLAAVLSESGYEVVSAQDGFEALATMREGLPHLIISDLKMPNMSGFELLGIVRKRFPSIAVIAMSGQFTPSSGPIDLLADRYLQKGEAQPIEVLEAVRELLSASPLRSQPPKADLAPVWLPRSRTNYVVLTCTECLRSFSVPSRAEVGRCPDELCPHCGSTVQYCVDETVIDEISPDGASIADREVKQLESSKRTIEEARQLITRHRKRVS